MEKTYEKLLTELEEHLKYFSQIGVDFIFKDFFKQQKPKKSVLKQESVLSLESRYLSLHERIIHCQKCSLALTRRKAVPGEGNLKADLMFVGEAPGADEDIQGKPFVGKAGQLLTKIINAMNLKRKDVYITNIVKCRPPGNRNPLGKEIERCKEYLFEQIEIMKPRIIVALGSVPAHFFIPDKIKISDLRGNIYDFNGIKIMPTFHPSYLVRNEANKMLKRMVWEDMKKVMAFLDKE